MSKFLTKKDDQIIFNGTYMEAYIPANMFDKGTCQYMGSDKVNIFGLFVFKISNANGNIDDKCKLQTFNFPSMFISKPSSVETRVVEFYPGKGEVKYIVLKFFKDDAVMFSSKVLSKIENIEIYINLLIEGNLPSTLSYDDLLSITLKCMNINGRMHVQALLFSVVISNMYRYKNNLTVPFRKIIGKGEASPLDYTAVNARTVCANDSTFSALIFEDADTMILSSVNRKRYNKDTNPSPVESLIK